MVKLGAFFILGCLIAGLQGHDFKNFSMMTLEENRAMFGNTCEEDCKLGISIATGMCGVFGAILSVLAAIPTAGAGAVVGAAGTAAVCTGVSAIGDTCPAFCEGKTAPTSLDDILKGQKEIQANITKLIKLTQNVEARVKANTAVLLTHRELYKLDSIHRKFELIKAPKKLGIIMKQGKYEVKTNRNQLTKMKWEATTFMELALHAQDGIRNNLWSLYNALTGKTTYVPDTLWKLVDGLCSPDNLNYFLGKFATGIFELGVAYEIRNRGLKGVQKHNVPKKVKKEFSEWIIQIMSTYYRDCKCVGLDNSELANRGKKFNELNAMLSSGNKLSDPVDMSCNLTKNLKDAEGPGYMNTNKIYDIRQEDINLARKLKEVGAWDTTYRKYRDTYNCYKKYEASYGAYLYLSHFKTSTPNLFAKNCIGECCRGFLCMKEDYSGMRRCARAWNPTNYWHCGKKDNSANPTHSNFCNEYETPVVMYYF